MPIYKDKKRGTWYFAFRKVIDGKTYTRFQRGFESKVACQTAELKAIHDLENPTTIKKDLTFEVLFNLYIEYKETNSKITTITTYQKVYNTHIKPKFADLKVFTITPNDLYSFKKELIKKHYTERFTNRVIGTMKLIIQFGLNKGYITNTKLLDELEHVKLNQIAPERQVLSMDQLDLFFKTFDLESPYDYKFYLYFLGLANSGMRPNEFRALQVQDIKGDYLVVNKALTNKVGKGNVLQPPKTKTSNRKVLMPHWIIELLLDYIKDYKNEPESFIFGRDKPFSETNIKRYLDKHLEMAKLPHIVVYGFRHSHATNLIKSGVPIKVVSKRLGHSNASTTMNVYWHLFNDDESQVIDVLNRGV